MDYLVGLIYSLHTGIGHLKVKKKPHKYTYEAILDILTKVVCRDQFERPLM